MSALVYISIKHVSVMFLFSKGKDANEPKAHANGRSLSQFPWHGACLGVLLLRPGRKWVGPTHFLRERPWGQGFPLLCPER